MDLQAVLREKIDATLASGVIEQTIETALENTLKRVIADALGEYSEFGKDLKKLVFATLKLPENVSLSEYNAAILEIVTRQLESQTAGVIQQQIAGRLTKLLEVPPAEINLSALIEAYKEHVQAKASYGCHCHGEEGQIYVELKQENSSYSSTLWTYITLSDEPVKHAHQAPIRIGVSSRDNEIFSLSFGGQQTEAMIFRGHDSDFEKLLFQAKVAKSKLIIDCDPDDLDLTFELTE